MFSERERIRKYLQTSIKEMTLIEQMSSDIAKPDDFGLDCQGMTIFRACSMSLMFVTEMFVQIRNRVTEAFFAHYPQIEWKSVFGMRNFLAHEYIDVDSDTLFDTVKKNIPELKSVAEHILADFDAGDLDDFIRSK